MSLEIRNKFNVQSPEVKNAKISKTDFITTVLNCIVENGSKYKPDHWEDDMYEVETTDGVYISRIDLKRLQGQEIRVTSRENNPDIGWVWLNYKSTHNSTDNSTLKHSFVEIQDALSADINNEACFVYKLEIGSDTYIGFTTQKPIDRVNSHINKSKEGGTQKVNKALRKWGYTYEIEILGHYPNEILGLLAEIKFIEKFSPNLNESIGGKGKNFKIVPRKNEAGEDIFVVYDKNNILD